MNSRLFNRIVVAKQRLDKVGINYITLTLETNDAMAFSDGMREAVADTMERMATLYEAMDDLGEHAVQTYLTKRETGG